jgi:hypothetical protein
VQESFSILAVEEMPLVSAEKHGETSAENPPPLLNFAHVLPSLVQREETTGCLYLPHVTFIIHALPVP